MAKFTVSTKQPLKKISFQIDCEMTRDELRVLKILIGWNATVPDHLKSLGHISTSEQSLMGTTMSTLGNALGDYPRSRS